MFKISTALISLAALAGLLAAAVGQAADTVYCGGQPLADQGINVAVRAVYKPDRHQYLRRTLRHLLHSEDIQTVMLGDSIVGDTFGPQYLGSGYHIGTAWGVESLAALYRTNIYAVVSVLGSTGVWYYRQPGNVQTYVLNYLPDLVFIGGISNRDDIDAMRDVVQQIQATRPETEIVLMTGAVNLQAMPTSSSLLLDTTANTYEARLAGLADELGTGFIDMRGSYNEFVLEANRLNPQIDQAYFQRDPIHANAYGQAILRELTTMFFRPAVECQDRAAARQRLAAPQALTLSVTANATPLMIDTNIPIRPAAVNTVIATAEQDINKDGYADHLELVSSSGDTDRLTIAADVSAPAAKITLPLNLAGASSFLLTDLNQDGWLDLVVGTNGSIPYLYVYMNTTREGQWFADPLLLAKSNPVACTVVLAAFDVNGDARNDLFAADGCVSGGAIDYYQVDGSLALNRQLPESYLTDMNITAMQVGTTSAQHLGQTLLITGASNGQTVTKELGVAQPQPQSAATTVSDGGNGAVSWFELSLFALLMAVRGKRSFFKPKFA